MSRIEVIIVNYNAGDALVRCVKSVLEQDEPLRLTVMDNASTDGSAEQLGQQFGHHADVTVVDSGGNPGFAGAVNMALHYLVGDALESPSGEYLLILNPDCEMRDGALAKLVQALDRDVEAALAAPLVVDSGGKALRGTLRRFPDPWKSFLTFTGLWRLGRRHAGFSGVDASTELPQETSQAEAVSGACMLLRKSVFMAAGGMDEAYGLHCEDLDLMYRLRLMGKHCLFVPAAVVYHEQGVSSRSRPVWVHWQKHRGMQRFFQKFQADEYSFPLRWLVIAGIWARFTLTLPMQMIRN
jgi:GT2 family glycosyltransferase